MSEQGQERVLEFTCHGVSDGTYFIWIPLWDTGNKLMIGRLIPEQENGVDGWAIYGVNDLRYGWHADGMVILPGYVDEFVRHMPEGLKELAEFLEGKRSEGKTKEV